MNWWFNFYTIMALPRIEHIGLHIINTNEQNKRSLLVRDIVIIRVIQANNK